MRILQVMAGAAHGGAETAFVDMCIALAEAGEQITVATRPNPLRVARLVNAGLAVHELPFGGAWDFFTTIALRKIIRRCEPHIVQTWMSRAAAKTPRWSPEDKAGRYLVVSRLGGYYKVRHFRTSDYFTTITPDIREHLIRGGIDPGRVRHINNFAETEQGARPVRRDTLDTPDGAPVLLALGRLHQAKAFDVLLRALSQAPGVYLWIAGEGPERGALEGLCDRLGLRERVRFLGWREDRASLLLAADICVFCSRYEPFGTVFVQAWAQKTPLIVTDADGPRQYVRDGRDGLVVPVDDVAALSAAIRRLAGDRELGRSLAAYGYERYLEEFTKDRTVAAYLAFYHDILVKEGVTTGIQALSQSC